MPTKKSSILLVEDDKMIVQMYQLRLEEEGFEVFSTDKGTEALAWAKEHQPDLVLLDIILPEVDGFTILQQLKSDQSTKKIPVLLLTNLAQETDRQRGIELGAEEYFVKSQHTPADIMETVRTLIKK